MEEIDRYPFILPRQGGGFGNGLDCVSNPKYTSDRNPVWFNSSISGCQHPVREEKQDGCPSCPGRNVGPFGNYLRG